MYIEIYEHTTPEYAIEPNEDRRRVCIALYDDKGTFVDSFDYKTITNQIRFYGDDKHYDWDEVPEYKQKLWKTKNFSKLLFHRMFID